MKSFSCRSQYIQRRIMLLKSLEPPLISDVKRNFGEEMANQIFCNCDEQFREDLGIEPGLKGVLDKELWNSPSDILLGKVLLKPPLTDRYLKAMKHREILEIGRKIEEMFWKQMEVEKINEAQEQVRLAKIMCGVETEQIVEKLKREMDETMKKGKMDVIEQLKQIHAHEMQEIKEIHQFRLEEELKLQEEDLRELYEKKKPKSLVDTTIIVEEETSRDLEIMEEKLYKAFLTEIHKSEIQTKFDFEKQRKKFKEHLQNLKHEMQCLNMANIMYVMCMERRKCESEKYQIKKYLSEEIGDLQRQLQQKNADIELVKNERDKHKKEVERREQALRIILQEYQKFINFCFESSPKQAEYLLCPEKLLLFDLLEGTSEDDSSHSNEELRNLLWTMTPTPEESEDISLTLKDGHECLKETELTESELSVGQFFPGFYYNDKVFVREDFRNAFASGIKISEHDMRWNLRVQKIQEHLEKVIDVIDAEEHDEELQIRRSKHLVTTFGEAIKTESSLHRNVRKSLLSQGADAIISTINFDNIGKEENKKTILSARNSLEILKNKIKTRKESEVKLLDKTARTQHDSIVGIEVKDSIIHSKAHKTISSNTEVNLNLSKHSLRKVPPKFRLSQNSISILGDLKKLRKLSISDVRTDDGSSQCLSECTIQDMKTFTGKPIIYDRVKKPIKKIMKPPPKQKRKRGLIKKQQKSIASTHTEETDTILDMNKKIIIGDSCMDFTGKTKQQFGNDRIYSFVGAIKDHPSLLRMFTCVTH